MVEINVMETKNKALAKLAKEKDRKNQINKIRDKKLDSTIDVTKTQMKLSTIMNNSKAANQKRKQTNLEEISKMHGQTRKMALNH